MGCGSSTENKSAAAPKVLSATTTPLCSLSLSLHRRPPCFPFFSLIDQAFGVGPVALPLHSSPGRPGRGVLRLTHIATLGAFSLGASPHPYRLSFRFALPHRLFWCFALPTSSLFVLHLTHIASIGASRTHIASLGTFPGTTSPWLLQSATVSCLKALWIRGSRG